MKKWLILTAGVSLLAGLIAGTFLTLRGTPAAQASDSRTIHVVEHAITDTVGDTLPAGDSLGDTLGFHNPVFDASNEHQVGTDNGACFRTVTGNGTGEWECIWTTILKDGQITVEGPFLDDGTDTTLAITGGTGAYTGAKGTMLLHARGNPVGSEFDFIFHLSK